MNHVLDIPCLSLSSCFAFGPIPLGQKMKKLGNKMLLSSKKIVKSDLWVKKNKMELNLPVRTCFYLSVEPHQNFKWVMSPYFNVEFHKIM